MGPSLSLLVRDIVGHGSKLLACMGKKRWNPPKGNTASDAIQRRKENGITWEERKELLDQNKKERGSATLASWEASNTEREVDDEIWRMNQEKVMRKEAENIRKKVLKEQKKKEKKEAKKAKKKEKKE